MAKIRFYRYTVEGTSQFPLDMLRYDCSFPETGVDVSQIDYSFDPTLRNVQRKEGKPFQVTLICKDREPTRERWSSFGWTVAKSEAVR